MRDILHTGLLGAMLGMAFGLLKQPPPVPQTFAGVAGILGIFAGWYITTLIRG